MSCWLVSALKMVPISLILLLHLLLRFLPEVSKIPCDCGGASWAGVVVPLGSDARVVADTPVCCLALACVCAPVLGTGI